MPDPEVDGKPPLEYGTGGGDRRALLDRSRTGLVLVTFIRRPFSRFRAVGSRVNFRLGVLFSGSCTPPVLRGGSLILNACSLLLRELPGSLPMIARHSCAFFFFILIFSPPQRTPGHLDRQVPPLSRSPPPSLNSSSFSPPFRTTTWTPPVPAVDWDPRPVRKEEPTFFPVFFKISPDFGDG